LELQNTSRKIMMAYQVLKVSLLGFIVIMFSNTHAANETSLDFEGQYFSGNGDREYLELLDISRRMFDPDPEFQNIPMLYTPMWNGFIEGPTWDAWWIQNSYGTTYCALPFYSEPYLTFLQNAQDLWFTQMGNGKREGALGTGVAPDGCLCDTARPGFVVYKQGDGKVGIHDWGVGFTAAGLLMQSELLLITRNREAISHYLPMLERCADFLYSRRDPNNNLMLAGAAGNLLAPSYAGYKKTDGSYGMAYLSELSVSFIAALDRLIELEKLAGNTDKSDKYREYGEIIRKGLPLLLTSEGYFIKSLDPDGTRHGIFGADKYGYFEATPNHDAICFRVVNDKHAEKICNKIASIEGLRPHDLIIANYPGLDDMYESPDSWLWSFGTWVNGGHWTTCEARMIIAYYRVGRFEDAGKSMKQILKFARSFKMDNPLVEFGSKPYQPNEPVNLCYDSFGAPAAMIRGLFEYLYDAEKLTLIPHIPPSITYMEQNFPIRFGTKEIYISVSGTGQITGVWINDKKWKSFDDKTVSLPYEQIPDKCMVQIALGVAIKLEAKETKKKEGTFYPDIDWNNAPENMKPLSEKFQKIQILRSNLKKAGMEDCYEMKHAQLVTDFIHTVLKRRELLDKKEIPLLPEPTQKAADDSYLKTADNLYNGLVSTIGKYSGSANPDQKKIYDIWKNMRAKE
jgi:hypothetical protein